MFTTRDVSIQDKVNWLRLARSENVVKSTFFRLIEIFGSVEKTLDNIYDFTSQFAGRKIRVCAESDAAKELANSQKFGAEILLFCEENYPRLLREIPDPTPILTIKGRTELLQQDAVAVVGPRNASFGAIAFAKKIAIDLAKNSIITVSGLARGVDTAAHQASLATGTIAVIAGGIDHIYPKENADLYHKISTQGLLISETPFGVPPKGGNFVQRNRLISGLSLAAIIVEAGLKSGSLVTARCAAEQGREVFAVPGSPFDPRCHGTNRLIKDGANMIENIDDLLKEFDGLKARFREVGMLREPDAPDFIAPEVKIPNENDIQKISAEILAKLDFLPITIDEIIVALQLPTRLVNIALVQLELADKIEVIRGKVVLKIS
jgi:DNA processing protein